MTAAEGRRTTDDARQRHAELDAKIRALRARTFDGSDRERLARVTVDGEGHFVGVRLDAGRLDGAHPDEVSAAVLAAFAHAREILAEALREALGTPPTSELMQRASTIGL